MLALCIDLSNCVYIIFVLYILFFLKRKRIEKTMKNEVAQMSQILPKFESILRETKKGGGSSKDFEKLSNLGKIWDIWARPVKSK